MPESINHYMVDIKVYEAAHRHEIPYTFAASAFDEYNRLIPGYHSFNVRMTETEFDEFEAWGRSCSILKVIGTTDIAVSPNPNSDETANSDLDLPMREGPPGEEG